MKDDYQFTQDWFSWSPPVWEQVFKQLKTLRTFWRSDALRAEQQRG
jgi:hypothetical protein